MMRELLRSVDTTHDSVMPQNYSDHLYSLLLKVVDLLPEYSLAEGLDQVELEHLYKVLQLRKVKQTMEGGADEKLKT